MQIYLIFRYAPEADASTTLKLKIEINTRKHVCLLGLRRYPFAVNSRWYQSTYIHPACFTRR
jgi:hypothetical protein